MNWLELYAACVFFGALACAVVLGVDTYDKTGRGPK